MSSELYYAMKWCIVLKKKKCENCCNFWVIFNIFQETALVINNGLGLGLGYVDNHIGDIKSYTSPFTQMMKFVYVLHIFLYMDCLLIWYY